MTNDDGRRMTDDGWRMTDDKAGQVQSELSAKGTKLDVENTPKCTRPDDPVKVRRPQGGTGPVNEINEKQK